MDDAANIRFCKSYLQMSLRKGVRPAFSMLCRPIPVVWVVEDGFKGGSTILMPLEMSCEVAIS